MLSRASQDVYLPMYNKQIFEAVLIGEPLGNQSSAKAAFLLAGSQVIQFARGQRSHNDSYGISKVISFGKYMLDYQV